MNESISQKIIKEIKHQDLKPISKFRVWFRNFLPWLFFAFVVLLGGLSLSLLLHIFSVQDWDVYSRLNYNFLYIYFRTVPYLWLFLMGVFFVITYFDYRYTKYGYKTNSFAVIAVLMILVVMCGVLINGIGFGDRLEKAIEDKIPAYDVLSGRSLWNDVQSGLLAGKIQSYKDGALQIITSSGEEYLIVFDSNILIKTELSIGLKIKIIGELIDGRVFQAKEIRSWCGCNMCAKQKTCGIEQSCCGM